jgi:hypothetical protein
MSETELWTLLRDPLQGTEAAAWQKAALELSGRLVIAQVRATSSQVDATKATLRTTYALVVATIAVAIFSIARAVLCL